MGCPAGPRAAHRASRRRRSGAPVRRGLAVTREAADRPRAGAGPVAGDAAGGGAAANRTPARLRPRAAQGPALCVGRDPGQTRPPPLALDGALVPAAVDGGGTAVGAGAVDHADPGRALDAAGARSLSAAGQV